MQKPKIKEGFPEEKIYVLPDMLKRELSQHPIMHTLYITDIGYFPHARYHYRERLHGSDAYIFIYCTEGEGWVRFHDEIEITLYPQQMLIIPAGIPHRYGASEEVPWSIYWFHLKGEALPHLISNLSGDSRILTIPHSGHLHLMNSFQKCYTLLTDFSYSDQHLILASQTMGLLLSTLAVTREGTKQESKRTKEMERVIRHMIDHLHHTLTLSDLADYAGLSKQHFITLFKQFTGYSPIDYFLRLKMQRASQMLHLTDLSVKEIGGALGIHDPYYFSRCFKRIYGLSPTQFRKVEKG